MANQALLEHNKRLLQLQAAARAAREANGDLPQVHGLALPDPQVKNYAIENAQKLLQMKVALRASSDTTPSTKSPPDLGSINVHAGLAIPLLNEHSQHIGVSRAWQIIRHNRDGREYIAYDRALAMLSDDTSPYRLWSKRTAQRKLREGNGIWWSLDKAHNRIYFRSEARVGAALGLPIDGYLGKTGIEIPVSAIVKGHAEYRAHLFRSFEEGRPGDPRPMSRQSLEKATGVPEATQKRLEALIGVRSRRNYSTTTPWTEQAKQKLEAEGKIVFDLVDHKGLQGPKGAKYVSFPIPSTRERSHKRASKSWTRKLIKSCRDSEIREIECPQRPPMIRYHQTKEAALMASHNNSREIIHRYPEYDHNGRSYWGAFPSELRWDPIPADLLSS